MCGIAGIVDFKGKRNATDTLIAMLKSIAYRGPDESGIYHSNAATIGSVRLSVIDLETGQQPMSDPSGRFWIVYNGEIFNYRELRTDLEKKGCTFKTTSDTEVLIRLFAIQGKKCLEKLNGQFAFAIWDKLEQELFIARDRVGIRPLFYNLTEGVLSFASEIKSIFRLANIKRELSPVNLSQIYTFWSAISPDTAFRDILELSPGHCLTFNRKGISVEQYWSLVIQPKGNLLSINEAAEQFDELLANAVSIRLRADVEVAAYLSGGIDSTATVSYIKNLEPGILNTFSIGFEEKDFDESVFQQEAVKYLNTNHRSINCSSKSISEIFPFVVWHSETPLLRTAPAPMLILSKLVRDNNIKVVITGEGSDEILAGYDIFREAKIRRFWASQPASNIRPALLKRIYHDIPHLRNASTNILKMFFGYRLNDTGNPFYSHLLRWNNANHIRKHLSREMKLILGDYSPIDVLSSKLPEGFDNWDKLAQAQWLETTIFMSGYLLAAQGDRMAMANSVEGRYPFLDYRMIEFCSSLPADYKLKGLNEKYLLKKVMKNRIPEIIIKRPKQPYRAPIKSVFITDDSPEYVREMLSDNYFRKAAVFDYKSVHSVIDKVKRNNIASETESMLLTAVISTHLLHYQYIGDSLNNSPEGKLKNMKIIEDTTN